MGTFRVDIEIADWKTPERRARVTAVLVDTGAELTCLPSPLLDSLQVERMHTKSFRQATGSVFERWIGYARVWVAGRETVDEVIFGEPGDLVLLGARSLEGLNFYIHPASKQLVDAGPMPQASVAA
jgi:predicted aspartyl protease